MLNLLQDKRLLANLHASKFLKNKEEKRGREGTKTKQLNSLDVKENGNDSEFPNYRAES